MNSGNLIYSNYKISGNDNLLDAKQGVTPVIKEKIKYIHSKILDNEKDVLDELKDLIKIYPHIPQFKNYLSVYYKLSHRNYKAHKTNVLTNKNHPDYLFGKLALALDYIDMKLFKKVPELLGDVMELKSLYPDRNEFHFSEVEGFLTAAIRYFIGIKNIEAAESRMKMLKDLNPDCTNIESLQYEITALMMEIGLERWENETKMVRTVKAKSKKIVPDSQVGPQLTNMLVQKLYENDFTIDHNLVREILSLDHESLIDDLHKVCYDSIARFKYFSKNTEWNEKTHRFLLHAIFLLTELKSEESLEVILDLFRQDEKFIDYWFSYSLSDLCRQSIYVLGFNRLNALCDFMKERDRGCYVRAEISSAVAQIALHNASRRNEIIDWYKELFNYFLQRQDDNRLIDTDLFGLMICDILDIKATELIAEIKILFDNNLVNPGVCGSYADILKDFKTPVRDDPKREILNIYDNYKDLSSKRYSEKPIVDYDAEKENFHIPLESDKVGRNDPCPCGSGKKYKKCCGS